MFRWKTVAGMDMVLNGLGYGAGMMLMGWFTTNTGFSMKIAFMSLIAFLTVAAGLPLSQVFQYEADKKNAKTFIVRFGVRKSFRISLLMFVLVLFLLNIFSFAYLTLVFNVVVSALALCSIFLVMYWYRQLGKADNFRWINIMFLAYAVCWMTFGLMIVFHNT